MPSIQNQIDAIERELANQPSDIVRTALLNQKSALQKKIVAGNNKKVQLRDGTMVGVGDTVFTADAPGVNMYNIEPELRKGTITAYAIFRISPKGEIAKSKPRYHSDRANYDPKERFFGTYESAKEHIAQQLAQKVDAINNDIAKNMKARDQLNTMQDDLGNYITLKDQSA